VTKLCVLGLGYIGLPTAAMFATHGIQVVGVDVNGEVVDTLNNGDVHIHEPGLKTLVAAARKSCSLRIATAPESADAFIIAVPTPLIRAGDGRRPMADLRHVCAAAEAIVPQLAPGNLVVLESTVPPRTVTDVLLPILRRSGLHISGEAGSEASEDDLLVAHCPERVLPGRILEELVGNDRVIGGVDRRSAEAARELYASFVQGTMLLTDATTAEMVKLMENTYRDVNIALANEFSLVAEGLGIDVWEAIALANRHPRVNILKPGPGVGGHCIAVDPWFIVEVAPEATHLIQAARRVNDSMPEQTVRRVRQALLGIEQPVVACLGLSYKGGTGDMRESPAIRVVELLGAQGCRVRAYDPYVEPGRVRGQVCSMKEALDGANAVLVLTDHPEFVGLPASELAGEDGRLVLDTRACLDHGASQSQPPGRQ